MKAILKRELKSYFNSPVIYILLSIFITISTIFFMIYNMMGFNPELTNLFYSLNTVLLFMVPVITMRLFSEEKTQKTEQLLLTSPNSITSIVMGKFLSAFVIYSVMIAFTFVFALIIRMFTNFDFLSYFVLLLGSLLMGASFISIGLFVSAVMGSVITTVLTTFGVLMISYFADAIPQIFGNPEMLTKFFSFFSLSERFQRFALGLLGLDSIVYFLSFTAVFVFLTIRVIDKKRWS